MRWSILSRCLGVASGLVDDDPLVPSLVAGQSLQLFLLRRLRRAAKSELLSNQGKESIVTVTLFPRKDFGGSAFVVDENHSVMSNTPIGHGATSMRLSAASDAALLCRREGWQGQSLFKRGPADLPHLGRPAQGGKTGLGNDVRSVRITPFGLRVHFHVVTTTGGDFPGNLASEADATSFVQDVVAVAAALWAPFLIRLDFNGVSFAADNDLFNVRGEFIKLARADEVFDFRQGMANPVLVDRVGILKGVAGKSLPACLTTQMAIEHQLSGTFPDGTFINGKDLAGYVLAHELGHFLGLVHRHTGNNLMRPKPVNTTNLLSQNELHDSQVEGAHAALGRADGAPDQLRVFF